MRKEFTKEDVLIFNSSPYHRNNVQTDVLILLTLVGLYEKKVITLAKLKGQISALRSGSLLKRKKTYHCEINNTWYDNEPSRDIFDILWRDYGIKTVSFKVLVEFVQLYTTKNFNYCINFIVDSIYSPALEQLYNKENESLRKLLQTNIMEFPELLLQGYSGTCYGCGSTHFTSDRRKTIDQISKVHEFFHSFKKGNLSKIPKKL